MAVAPPIEGGLFTILRARHPAVLFHSGLHQARRLFPAEHGGPMPIARRAETRFSPSKNCPPSASDGRISKVGRCFTIAIPTSAPTSMGAAYPSVRSGVRNPRKPSAAVRRDGRGRRIGGPPRQTEVAMPGGALPSSHRRYASVVASPSATASLRHRLCRQAGRPSPRRGRHRATNSAPITIALAAAPNDGLRRAFPFDWLPQRSFLDLCLKLLSPVEEFV